MTSQHDSSLDLSDLLKPHVGLLIWIIFIVFGGGVLALYYADIHYLPEIAWEASLTFLGVISIIGGTIVVILSLLLFFPGFIWCRFLICDKLLDKHVFHMRGEGIGETCIFQIITRLGVPFLLLIGLAHVFLLLEFQGLVEALLLLMGSPFILLIGLTHVPLLLEFQGAVFFVWALVLLIIFFWYIWRLFLNELWGKKSFRSKPLHSRLFNPSFWFNVERFEEISNSHLLTYSFWFDLHKSKRRRSKKRHHDAEKGKGIHPAKPSTSRLFKYAFWFDMSVMVSFTSMYIIYEMTKGGKGFLFLAVTCTAIVFLSNCAVAVLYSKYSARAIAVSIVAATLMLFAADSSSSLTTKLMAMYGFGGEQMVTVVVNRQGCEIIQQLGMPPCPHEAYGQLDPMKLLSRLGSEYFFEFDQKRFALPKSSVVSWSIKVDLPVSENASSRYGTGLQVTR